MALRIDFHDAFNLLNLHIVWHNESLAIECNGIKLMNFATIEHVARFLGVPWHLLKNIHKSHLLREYKGVEFEKLRYIGIDEFSIRKGHEYMTIFINLESGEIIHAVRAKALIA